MKRTDQDGPITLGSLAWRFEIIEAEEDAGGAGEGIEEIPEPVKRDFNAASAEDLKGLPGIGPALAERIIARRRSAPFRSVDELIEVSGIGLKKLQELRPLVAVRMPWSCSTKTCQGCHWHLMAVTNRGRTIRAEGETAAAARLAAPELAKLDGSRNGAGQGGERRIVLQPGGDWWATVTPWECTRAIPTLVCDHWFRLQHAPCPVGPLAWKSPGPRVREAQPCLRSGMARQADD